MDAAPDRQIHAAADTAAHAKPGGADTDAGDIVRRRPRQRHRADRADLRGPAAEEGWAEAADRRGAGLAGRPHQAELRGGVQRAPPHVQRGGCGAAAARGVRGMHGNFLDIYFSLLSHFIIHSVPVVWSFWLFSVIWSLENVFPYMKFWKYGHFGYIVHF